MKITSDDLKSSEGDFKHRNITIIGVTEEERRVNKFNELKEHET